MRFLSLLKLWAGGDLSDMKRTKSLHPVHSRLRPTWLIHVLGLRVRVRCVAEWGFVGVRGKLMIELLWAVDENGKTLHLTKSPKGVSMKQNWTGTGSGGPLQKAGLVKTLSLLKRRKLIN